jgi:hypothetical protein
MSNPENSARNSTALPVPSAHASSDRAAALIAYMALVQHVTDLSQSEFDAEVAKAIPPIIVLVRLVS